MDNYLIDRETLGGFIDELIKKKPLPVNAAEELTNYREEQIKALDDRISQAIFGGLTDDQDRELNNLLDRGEPSSETLESFFSQAGINIDETIKNAMESFAKEYLGVQNV